MPRLSVLEDVLRPEQVTFLEDHAESPEHALRIVRDAVETKIKQIAGRPDYESREGDEGPIPER